MVNSYFSRWRQVIEQHGGVVEKFIGDAVMAVFIGLEDDPHRAIRAALAMKTALGELNAGLETEYGITLAMRVGIDTGEVVVSMDRPDQEVSVVGETVNLASRLQAEAPADEVLISGDTHRHVRRLFLPPARDALVQGRRRSGRGPCGQGAAPPVRARRRRGVEGVDTRTIGATSSSSKSNRPSRTVDEGSLA